MLLNYNAVTRQLRRDSQARKEVREDGSAIRDYLMILIDPVCIPSLPVMR